MTPLLMIFMNNPQLHKSGMQFRVKLPLLCLNNYPAAFLHSLDIEFIFFTYNLIKEKTLMGGHSFESHME